MGQKIDKNSKKVLQVNKKAFFNYEVIDKLECGISLAGTEVKSIREGRFSFSDSYIKVDPDGLILVSFLIQNYKQGSIYNKQTDRNRRLLAHKQEIKRLRRKVEEKGFTIVPLCVYLKGNLVKVEIGLCRGKQEHDKRAAIKERDQERAMRREIRENNY